MHGKCDCAHPLHLKRREPTGSIPPSRDPKKNQRIYFSALNQKLFISISRNLAYLGSCASKQDSKCTFFYKFLRATRAWAFGPCGTSIITILSIMQILVLNVAANPSPQFYFLPQTNHKIQDANKALALALPTIAVLIVRVGFTPKYNKIK